MIQRLLEYAQQREALAALGTKLAKLETTPAIQEYLSLQRAAKELARLTDSAAHEIAAELAHREEKAAE